jgi:hypothetical protein
MKTTYFPVLIFYFISLTTLSHAQCLPTANYPTAFYSDPFAGSCTSWTNPSRTQLSDNNRAQAGYLLGVLATANTDYLDIQNLGLSVPAGVSICGIEVVVERRAQGIVVGSSIKDNSIKLIKDGVICGNNHAYAAAWPTIDGSVSYGGPTDLWGLSLTPADVNSPYFGCLISAQLNSGLASVFLTAEIDLINVIVYYSSAPLPIELQNFELSKLRLNKVKASWTTASEYNNDYFSVERSPNGVRWENLGSIEGSGNTSTQNNYSFIDENPLEGISYYRLKQTDFNGSSTYSEVKSMDLSPASDSIFIAPNPAGDHIRLFYNSGAGGIITFSLYNIQGQILKQSGELILKELNQSTLEIPVNDLDAGLYFYKATVNQKEFSGRLIKN